MRLIIGLGNPGKKYEATRHNAGFRAVDELARQKNLSWQLNKKFKSEVAEGPDYLLIKPQTFMNKSGEAVATILRYYKLLPKTLFGTKKDADLTGVLTVIHDELDLPLSSYKIVQNNSSAGHRGVQSIIDYLKTKNFKRIRIGISTETREQIPGDDFVLQKFSPEEQKIINKLLPEIIEKI